MKRLFLSLAHLAFAYLLGCVAGIAQQQAWSDLSPHKTQFVTVDDAIQLEVLDWGGNGRSIVLLAGYQTAHVYDEFAPKLTDIARVIGITRRGFGASSRPAGGYSTRQSADDVARVLDALKIERPVLVGHSFGGQDLTALGAMYPNRMAALVYLNSADDTTIGPVNIDPKLREVLRESVQQPDRRSFTAYRDWQLKTYGMAMPEAELRQMFAANPDGSVGRPLSSPGIREAMFAGLEAPNYSQIRVPVLAIFGTPAPLDEQMKRANPQTPEQGMRIGLRYALALAWVADNTAALKRGVPDARTVNVAGANAYIFLSNEKEVLQYLRPFLATIR